MELPRELEDAIVAAPDDREAYLVAADWLQDRGAFQGELVVGDDRERAIALLPPALRGESAFTIEWRWGFVRGVMVTSLKDANEPALLRELLASPIARFVQKLVVQNASTRLVEAVAVRSARELRCLRTLMLFMDEGARPVDMSRLPPTLQRLVVRGPVTGVLAQPALHELALDRSGSDVVRDALLPVLAQLHVTRPFDAEPDRWLDPERLPALRWLHLATPDPLDEARWEAARIAPQLELLDVFVLAPGHQTRRDFLVDRSAGGPAALLALVGGERGQLIPLTPPEVAIDTRTHRPHARLEQLSRWYVTRAPEVADVFVNGHDVASCPLRSMDEVAVGARVFRYLQGDIPALAAQLRTRYGL